MREKGGIGGGGGFSSHIPDLFQRGSLSVYTQAKKTVQAGAKSQ